MWKLWKEKSAENFATKRAQNIGTYFPKPVPTSNLKRYLTSQKI